MTPGWKNAVHLRHYRVTLMGGAPERFIAACGSVVSVGTSADDELPRCRRCEDAERRMKAAGGAA